MNVKNGALTFAFTIAGACIGWAVEDAGLCAIMIFSFSMIGGFLSANADG